MIKKGDIVSYTDSEYDPVTRNTIKIVKQGIWDGTKVILNDKEKTTVRKKEWLSKVPEINSC